MKYTYKMMLNCSKPQYFEVALPVYTVRQYIEVNTLFKYQVIYKL
jgi:hypothetical protein